MNTQPSDLESDALPLRHGVLLGWAERAPDKCCMGVQLKVATGCQNMAFLVAERSFDLRTSGLWAQHASTAPLCFPWPILASQPVLLVGDSVKETQKSQAMWRCRGLNPGPFTCKANALPLRYIPYQGCQSDSRSSDHSRPAAAAPGSHPKRGSPCHDSSDGCRDQDSNLGCFGHNEEY